MCRVFRQYKLVINDEYRMADIIQLDATMVNGEPVLAMDKAETVLKKEEEEIADDLEELRKSIQLSQERLEKSIEKRNEQVQAMKKLAQQQKDDKDTIKRQKDALDNANENALKSKDEIKRLKEEGFVVLNETPKKGADNKLVAFVHPKSTNGVLVELCQEIN